MLSDVQLALLVDCHMHPHDSPSYNVQAAKDAQLKCSKIACMSSNLINQEMTLEFFNMHPDKVIPCYGIHPWFCHPISFEIVLPEKQLHYAKLFKELPEGLIDNLPDPVLWSTYRETLGNYLLRHDFSMLGEVGLDKSFKLPKSGGRIAPHSIPNREGPIEYTNLKTPIDHQIAVLQAQINLAIELGKNISMHCVTSQGPMWELIRRIGKENPKFKAINVDFHSWGGSVEVIQDLQRRFSNTYFSFSTTINSRSPRLKENILAVKENRLLVESDWASVNGHDERLSEIVEIVAEAKEWTIDHT